MPGRTGQQCAQRWRHKVNPNIRKDKWTDAEDATVSSLPRATSDRPVTLAVQVSKNRARTRLAPRLGPFFTLAAHPLPSLSTAAQELVKIHGLRWADISRHMPGRTDQQCMGRWRRHLDPAVSRERWTTREDRRLTELRVKHGANWRRHRQDDEEPHRAAVPRALVPGALTGHRYLDADGNLLSPRAADKAEREIDFAKAAAEAAGKTLRPNGVKASATNHNIDAIINSKGIVKDEKPDGRGKKRKSPGTDSGSDAEDRRRSLGPNTLPRDASGRFARSRDDGWTPAATPAAAAAPAPAPAPPALRVKAAVPSLTDSKRQSEPSGVSSTGHRGSHRAGGCD